MIRRLVLLLLLQYPIFCVSTKIDAVGATKGTSSSTSTTELELVKSQYVGENDLGTQHVERTLSLGSRQLQSANETANQICSTVQTTIFQDQVTCDCLVSFIQLQVIDVDCTSAETICSPSEFVCGKLNFATKFNLLKSGDIDIRLCIYDLTFSTGTQVTAPLCVNYKVEVLENSLETLCPDGLIACLFTGPGGGPAPVKKPVKRPVTRPVKKPVQMNTPTGGGGGGMKKKSNKGKGMEKRRLAADSLERSVKDNSSSSSSLTRVTRRVQSNTNNVAVQTAFVNGCDVTIGDTKCNFCIPCDTLGGILFDCTNIVPELKVLDSCVELRPWLGIGSYVTPSLPDIVLST